MWVIQGKELRDRHDLDRRTSRNQVISEECYLDEYSEGAVGKGHLFVDGKMLESLHYCGWVKHFIPDIGQAKYIEYKDTEEQLALVKPWDLLDMHATYPSVINDFFLPNPMNREMHAALFELDRQWLSDLLSGKVDNPNDAIESETTEMLLRAYAITKGRYRLWTREQLVQAYGHNDSSIELDANPNLWGGESSGMPELTWFQRKCRLYPNDSISVVGDAAYSREVQGGKQRSYTLHHDHHLLPRDRSASLGGLRDSQ